jgi:hypothetical protein
MIPALARRARTVTAAAAGKLGRGSLNWPQEDGLKWLRLCGDAAPL